MSDTYLIPQFIIDYLQKSKSTKIPQNLVGFLLNKNKTLEIEEWFKENRVTASYLWKNFVFFGLNKYSFKKCPTCGKELSIKQILKGSRFCSKKCANTSENVKAKMQSNREQSCLEKYGVKSYSKTEEFKKKYKRTSLERYGVDNPFKNAEIQKKQAKTLLEKYSIKNISQLQKNKEKVKETFLEKYGVENPSQLKEFRETAFKTRRSNSWNKFLSILKSRKITPLFSKEEYINDTGRMFKCLICGEEFTSEGCNDYMKEHPNKDGTYTTLIPYAIYCPHCLNTVSKKEKDVLEFIKSIYHGEVLENDRKVLAKKGKKGNQKELDIYLPSLKLAIEFDGDYWHSSKRAQKRDKEKDALCKQKGIRLIRIKEMDWDKEKTLVESNLSAIISECSNLHQTASTTNC